MEPTFDPRIDQANERTLLAWVRTGLGLMAFGFVAARAGDWMRMLSGSAPQALGPVGWIGIVFVAFGSLFPVLAVVQFRRVRQAIQTNRPIPTGGVLAPAVALLLAVAGGILTGLLATG